MASQSRPKTVGHVATFDLATPVEDGEIVRYPDSLLFRSGSYPQKSFDMTPAELAAAVESFTDPVPNEIEHFTTAGTPTILDGNLGHVESVRLSDDGTELRGTVAIPKWLDKVWKGPHKQVSAVWDRGTKTLRRLGLVVKGHVEGAALFAAFSDATGTEVPPEAAASFTPRKTTPEDTAKWQALHDALSGLRPEVCGATFGDTPKQRKGFRKAHGQTIEHGAKCGPAAMSEVQHECRCAAGSDEMTAKQQLMLKLGDKAEMMPDFSEEQAAALVAMLGGGKADAAMSDEAAAFAETPYAKAMRAELDALKAVRLADAKAARKKDANQFAKDLARSGHIAPANLAVFAGLVERAMEDDAATPAVVTFSHDGADRQGGRTEALLALIAARPKSGGETSVLEAIQDGTLAEKYALFTNGDGHANGGNAETAEARRKRLLSMTDVGRAALKAEK